MPPDDLHVVHHHQSADHIPVILVHGAPDRSKNFAKVLPLLEDIPVTVYDRRGYGKSLPARPPSRGFEDHVDDLLAIIDGKRSVVVGNSAGGLVTLMTAIRAPEVVAAIGVWEPPVVWAPWWPHDDGLAFAREYSDMEPAALAERFNQEMLGDRWEALPERTREMLRAEGFAFQQDLLSQLRRPFDVEDLKVPIVVGCGTLAHEMIEGGMRALAKRTSGELFLPPDTDHFVHTNAPHALAEMVRRVVALAEAQ
ncbi:MAG: alpha/beta hydrolase fold protein [Acidimicrobiia bacterium]|nr:alpha/beta hydrolase fold protein [Acidimicrobiia bacterium]